MSIFVSKAMAATADMAAPQPALRQEQLRRVQVDMLYAQLPPALAASLVNACVLAAVTSNAVGRTRAVGWLGALALVAAARAVLWLVHKRRNNSVALTTWHYLFRAGALLGGSVWGAAAFVLLPGDDPGYAALLGMLVAGTTAGAAASMSACRTTFLCFFLPMVSAYGASMGLHSHPLMHVMAWLTLFFIATTWITSRKTHESTLEALRLRFENLDLLTDLRALHDATPAGIFRLGADGRCVSISEGHERITGFPPGRVLGVPWSSLVHPADMERVKSEVGRSQAERQPFKVECRMIAADGRTIWIIAQGTPELGPRGEFSGFAGTFTDITERKRAEELLARSHAGLETLVAQRTAELQREHTARTEAQAALARTEKLEALTRLTGGFAHDFNNLLQVIIGSLNLIALKTDSGNPDPLVGDALSAARTAAGLTERLQPANAARSLEPVLVDANRQIEGMVSILQRTVGSKVRLATDLAPDIGLTRIDPRELEAAILNLALNSRDAMPSGGTLTLSTRNCRDDVVVAVRDTGVGMPADVARQVFEPFFTTKARGTGLGLSSTGAFVRRSGGGIDLETAPGAGTTVTLRFPRVSSDAPHGDAARVTPAARTRANILVVEDDPDVRRITRSTLVAHGFGAVEAADGPSAIAMLESDPSIDLVFSDIRMPGGLSGVDLARHVRSRSRRVPVLLTSAFATEFAQAGELAADGIRILRKPYDDGQLERWILETLASETAAPKS